MVHAHGHDIWREDSVAKQVWRKWREERFGEYGGKKDFANMAGRDRNLRQK